MRFIKVQSQLTCYHKWVNLHYGNANGGTVPILGAFIGCNYTDLLGNTVFTNKYPGTASVKSSTEVTALVADEMQIKLFLIGCNAGITQADVLENANFSYCRNW